MNSFFFLFFQLIGDTIPEEDDEIDILWEFIDSLYCMIDPSIDGPLKRFPFLRNFPGKYGNAYRRTISARDRVAKRYFDDIKVCAFSYYVCAFLQYSGIMCV